MSIRFHPWLVVLTLSLPFFLASTAHANKQDDLDKLRQRISSLQKDFEKANESKAEVADDLRESERAISDSNRALEQLAQQQRTAKKDLAALQQRAGALRGDMREQQTLLGRLLYQQYIGGGDRDYLKLLLNDIDANQLARDLQYYQYIARSRADTMKSIRSNLDKLREITAEVRAKSEEVAALQAEELKGLQKLERDKHARQQTLNKIAMQLKQQRREIGRLQRNESHLSQLVEKLAHMLPNIDGKPFKSLQGKLALPVNGKRTNKFGVRRAENNLMWTGWFLRAPTNQSVKAVAGGRVVYADWLRGFGNLLIIDHGQGYMSLYGNNETLYKQVGDNIHAGDIVATVGNSGGNEDSGLYFEIRHQGKAFDPLRWVSLK
ncbi:MAG: peptidoglycan DD-metalloendopeptidase family protein, partial [Gallionella sp.]|nr:peptidoglycan DD-metalloendopeptidase family protein [Gallionella sp.]